MPNEDRLVTCGSDGCFKTWTLVENKPQASNSSATTADSASSSSMSWIYDTCNGYRDLTPVDVDFARLDESNMLVAVAFNSTIALWTYSSTGGGVEFHDELFNCDKSDMIRQVKFLGSDNLLAIHGSYLNLWQRASRAKRAPSDDELTSKQRDEEFNCTWCKEIKNETVSICSVVANDSNLWSKQSSNQLLLTFSGEQASQIRLATFELESGGKSRTTPKLTFIHELVNSNPNGATHFVCIGKPNSDDLEQPNNDAHVFSFKNHTNLIYCDNKGVRY